jgi:hypothetical protein
MHCAVRHATGREKDLEDEDERVRDVDDLILAARAGCCVVAATVFCPWQRLLLLLLWYQPCRKLRLPCTRVWRRSYYSERRFSVAPADCTFCATYQAITSTYWR